MDHELRVENYEKVMELYPEFIFYFESLLNEIKAKLIFENKSRDTDKKAFNKKNAEQLMHRLIPYLKNGDFNADSLIPEIKDIFQSDDNIILLIKQIEGFDFEDALNTIDKIRKIYI